MALPQILCPLSKFAFGGAEEGRGDEDMVCRVLRDLRKKIVWCVLRPQPGLFLGKRVISLKEPQNKGIYLRYDH